MKGAETLRLLTAAMLFRRNAGLTSLESLVLHAVAVEEGRCLIQLAQATNQSPDQITKICRRLGQKNLTVLRTDVTDIRRKRCYLTPEGTRYVQRMIRVITRAKRPE